MFAGFNRTKVTLIHTGEANIKRVKTFQNLTHRKNPKTTAQILAELKTINELIIKISKSFYTNQL